MRKQEDQNNLTEEMKNTDQLYWVGMMNNFKNQAEEIVLIKNNNSDYKELQNKVNEIMEKYPNLQLLFEDDKVMNLNEEECKMLQN